MILFLLVSNGKAVHYNGASLLQWRSVRLDVTLCAGDVAGIGWERTGEPPIQGQTPKGQVYFTYNGRRLSAAVEDVSGCMYPIVHIQKKVISYSFFYFNKYLGCDFLQVTIPSRVKLMKINKPTLIRKVYRYSVLYIHSI